MSREPREQRPESAADVPADQGLGLWRGEYWIVLGMLSVSYVLCALQATPNPTAVALLVQLVTVAVILRVAQVRPRVLRWAQIILAVAIALATFAWITGAEGQVLDLAFSGASVIAYLIAPAAVLLHQARRPQIDGQTLLAAISAYILVGMFFTFVFNFVALATGVPVFGPGNVGSLSSQLFFSFSTLTTTGYGNLVPEGPLLESLAIAEAITGQLFLVIAVARVVTGWTSPARPGASGA